MKRKLLSPTELKAFREQQSREQKDRAKLLEKLALEAEAKNKKLRSPKDLLDPPIVVEEPVIEEVVEEPKDPIEVLRERLEEISSAIIEPKFYDEEIERLENLIVENLNQDVDLLPIYEELEDIRRSILLFPEVKSYEEDIENLRDTARQDLDEVKNSAAEMFQLHGTRIKELKKLTFTLLDDFEKKIIPNEDKLREDLSSTKEEMLALQSHLHERLASLRQEMSNLPRVKYYDTELKELTQMISDVQKSIPEVKSYDDEIDELTQRIVDVHESIPVIPDLTQYDDRLFDLIDLIEEVRESIPELPEVRYYENEISHLENQIHEVENRLSLISKSRTEDTKHLSEEIIKLKNDLVRAELHTRSISKKLSAIDTNEQVDWSHDIAKIYHEIEGLKNAPQPISEDKDPLTPLDQNFVTFDDLKDHYRLFINRVQQQLMSLGGGGEVNLRFLDDIDRSTIADGKVLSYDAASGKFKFISPGAASSLWREDGDDIYRNSNVGINSEDPQVALDVVGDASISGVITATTFSGNFSGTLTGEFVGNLDKTLAYQAGSLSTITTAQGTKTLYYNPSGILTSIVGTGVYVSKEFTYDVDGNLISVNVL